jgi:outer membrane lipoprotein-sorting protein
MITARAMKALLPAFAALFASSPAVAATLPEVQRALTATSSMSADFVQTAADGRQARGTMLLKRPGRIRFDYGKGATYLVVSNGQRLSFVDYKVAQVSEWPIRSTPLGVLLDPSADLARVARIVPDAENPMPGKVAVLAQDPKRADLGRILFFLEPDSSAPGGLRLTGWRVTDAQSNLTVVELSNIRFGATVPESAFTFRDPRVRTRPPGKTG